MVRNYEGVLESGGLVVSFGVLLFVLFSTPQTPPLERKPSQRNPASNLSTDSKTVPPEKAAPAATPVIVSPVPDSSTPAPVKAENGNTEPAQPPVGKKERMRTPALPMRARDIVTPTTRSPSIQDNLQLRSKKSVNPATEQRAPAARSEALASPVVEAERQAEVIDNARSPDVLAPPPPTTYKYRFYNRMGTEISLVVLVNGQGNIAAQTYIVPFDAQKELSMTQPPPNVHYKASNTRGERLHQEYTFESTEVSGLFQLPSRYFALRLKNEVRQKNSWVSSGSGNFPSE